MAYAAVTRLYKTIHHLLNSDRISVASSTKEILRSAGQGAESLQRILVKYDAIKNSSEGVMAVDARIRDEAQKLEDAIESEASAQFLLQSQSHGRVFLNLDHLKHVIDCFLAREEKMSAEYMEELHKPSPVAVSPTTESVRNDCHMVGLSDLFLKLIKLILDNRTNLLEAVISGMAGIGKTILARKLFHDSLVKGKFECRAFVRVGQKYQFEDILRAILPQLNVEIVIEGDENIQDYFKRILRGRKFLFVFDDVWDYRSLRSSFRDFLLLPSCGGSFLLVTTRIKLSTDLFYDFDMRFLNEEESWELLRREVFGEGDCPPQLVKAGKKIAENCEGLPLLILTVAKHLSENNPEYWKKVAEMKTSVFDDACDQIYEVLLPSYHFMTQNEKACFLYMAVFPNNDAVRRSRIINFWRAEAFAYRLSYVLDYIIDSNLAVVSPENVGIWHDDWVEPNVKACNLHIVYRHLSKRESKNIKFMCILNRYADGTLERIKDMRRLAIHHNTLLAIKEVHNSIASVSSLRSVLCSGPYHQYQVPICLELKLLRVLDALSICFYEFPAEVVNLIQLKYLSLTTNANLPPSIHKLWFLQFLIVHQHLSINRLGVPEKYLPVEIWELQELQHLQIIGRNLPHPPPGVILPNLTHLLDVGVETCGKGVLESIPNLEKLRIQIESAPDAAHTDTMSCFDHISCLRKLRSLQCVIRNPIATVPSRLLTDCFTSGIKKLTLSGCGYPWTDMSKIAELPRLKVLKLQCYAFRGIKWVANEMRFKSLHYLLIEDTDLAQWTAEQESFPHVRFLTMKNCHKLQEIPQLRILRIELVDCNPLAETSAKQHVGCNAQVSYSWK